MGPLRSDIEMAETAHAALFESTVDGGGFANGRYTRHAERFGYVMAERADGPALEEKIDQALGARGATIGWATGARFTYVDLAFVEAPPIDLLRSVDGAVSFVALDEDAGPIALKG
jgi:hypothetical protein